MVFLGIRYPSPASRRVATDYGAARGFNYAAEHVGASRSSPPAPPPKPASSRGAEPRDGFRLFSLPYATDSTFVRVGAGAGDFARAKRVMERWGHFQLGWSEADPDTGVVQAIQSVSAPTSSACGSETRSRLYTTNPAAAAAAAARGAAADARRNASPLRTDARRTPSSPARRRLSSSAEKTTACGTASTPSPGRRTRSLSWDTPPCARYSGNSRRIPRARFEKGCATRKRRSLSRETSGGGDEDEDGDGDEDEDQSASVRRFQARRKPSRWSPHAPAEPEAWKLISLDLATTTYHNLS